MSGQLINEQRLEDQNVENQDIEEQPLDDLDDDLIVPELDISDLVIEDDTPVDNLQSAQQQRLLVEPLYSSKALPTPFFADANIGLFYKYKTDPIVPDVMLSLGVQRAEDFSDRRNRSYFLWEFGKLPEVCIELVSNREGDELKLSQKSRQRGKTVNKREIYAQIGIDYYVVFDPLEQIQDEDEMNGALLRVWEMTQNRYRELTPAEGITTVGQSVWLDRVGVGLTLWSGQFEEERTRLWLRWCSQQAQVVATGAERAEAESQRAEAESQRAEAESQRAEAESQRAEAESQRAEQERQARLDAVGRLRSLHLTPEQIAEALSLSVEEVRSIIAGL